MPGSRWRELRTARAVRQYAYETKAAYGAGAQVHFFGLAVRGEYERISSTFGDPDAFTVSATWSF